MDGMTSRVVRMLASVVVALGVLLATAGCTTYVACPAIGVVNALYLDATPWLAAHPSGRLQVCFDDRCTLVDATSSEPVTLGVLGAHPGGAHALTVKSVETADSAQTNPDETSPVQISETIKLIPKSVGPSKECPLTAWGLNARITANGTLTTHGWTGHVLPPTIRTTAASTPAAMSVASPQALPLG